jgi:hypothetical protein
VCISDLTCTLILLERLLYNLLMLLNKIRIRKMKTLPFAALVFISALCLFCNSAFAQQAETLLGSEPTYHSMWSLELKTNSVKSEIGSLLGIYWGTVLNRTFILGVGIASNLTHEVTNYSYFQFLAQYVWEPDKLIHYGGQIIFGLATAKDYQNPKTNMFDNFANTSGTGFYFIEPRVNAELNLTKSEKVVLGLSYCAAFGLNSQNKNIAKSKVTNKDLSGINITVGVKFGEY